MDKQNPTVELWDGYSVSVDTRLIKDVDFLAELNEAFHNNDFKTIISMYMALVGGQDTYDKIRAHLLETTGEFNIDDLTNITEKIDTVLPKGGNRASRHSWKKLNF